MSKQTELSYLQLRFAAANAAADATTDRGVKVTHRQFAAAYARRMATLVAADGTPVTVSSTAASGIHPAWAKNPSGTRSCPATAKAALPVSLNDVSSPPIRHASDRRLS
jgi:hypothetical protein